MKTIPIHDTNKVFAVDDRDYEKLVKFDWYQYPDGHIYRNELSTSNVFTNAGNARTVHISVADEIYGTKGKKYDHRDMNPANNMRSNLRRATQSQNMANRRAFNGRKYKGPSWHKRIGKWQGQIMKDGKNIHLGYFNEEVLAAIAYDDKALELFGEFASLNFPLYGA